MKLSPRLLAVTSFVKKGSRVADIGTDHGYVPIWLIEEGIADSALAMDVRKGPLERAESHIRLYGLEDRIQTRLSDGLKELRAGEADTVVIAGMGGELVIHILEEGRHVRDTVKHWILSPQSEPDKVRRYLEKNGFVTEDEVMLIDEEKYYTVLLVRGPESGDGDVPADGFRSGGRDVPVARPRSGGGDVPAARSRSGGEAALEAGSMSEAEYLYGRCLIRRKDPVLKEYLTREKKTLEAIWEQLKGQDSEGAKRRRSEVEHEISMIEEVQHEMR